MYLDILSAASYGRYNIKLAHLTNLTTACYWSCLLDIIARVVKKNKFDKEGFFLLDRKYVQQQTNLPAAEQIKCDAILAKLGVLQVHSEDNNKIAVSLENMTSLLIESDAKQLKRLTSEAKKTKVEKAEGKRAGIVSRLQASITEQDEELRTLYLQWCDVVYDKGVQRVPQVEVFVSAIEAYTSNIDIRKAVVKRAISLAYKDPSWAINAYEKEVKQSPAHLPEQKIATKISTDYEF